MKKIFSVFTFLLVTFSLMALADSETRNLSEFSHLSVATSINATLVKGSTNKIDIEAEGIALEKISTEVKEGQLTVKIKNNKNGKKSKVNVTITYSGELKSLSSSSSAKLISKGTISSRVMNIDASSSSKTTVSLDVQELNVNVSSSASITIAGSSNTLDIDASSSGSFHGYEMKCKNVIADASSAANIEINVSDQLEVDASSGAKISYKGSPNQKNIDKSSGARVNAAK